jgi:hypothetical protein
MCGKVPDEGVDENKYKGAMEIKVGFLLFTRY